MINLLLKMIKNILFKPYLIKNKNILKIYFNDNIIFIVIYLNFNNKFIKNNIKF